MDGEIGHTDDGLDLPRRFKKQKTSVNSTLLFHLERKRPHKRVGTFQGRRASIGQSSNDPEKKPGAIKVVDQRKDKVWGTSPKS